MKKYEFPFVIVVDLVFKQRIQTRFCSTKFNQTTETVKELVQLMAWKWKQSRYKNCKRGIHFPILGHAIGFSYHNPLLLVVITVILCSQRPVPITAPSSHHCKEQIHCVTLTFMIIVFNVWSWMKRKWQYCQQSNLRMFSTWEKNLPENEFSHWNDQMNYKRFQNCSVKWVRLYQSNLDTVMRI